MLPPLEPPLMLPPLEPLLMLEPWLGDELMLRVGAELALRVGALFEREELRMLFSLRMLLEPLLRGAKLLLLGLYELRVLALLVRDPAFSLLRLPEKLLREPPGFVFI